jgi:putative Mg2+ transporter-C (MgtC) family protein
VKPLEEVYRARNQSCQLSIEASRGTLTPELVKDVLSFRPAQIKRFLVKAREAGDMDDITVIIGRVTSQDITAFVGKLRNMDGVSRVNVVSRDADKVAESA